MLTSTHIWEQHAFRCFKVFATLCHITVKQIKMRKKFHSKFRVFLSCKNWASSQRHWSRIFLQPVDWQAFSLQKVTKGQITNIDGMSFNTRKLSQLFWKAIHQYCFVPNKKTWRSYLLVLPRPVIRPPSPSAYIDDTVIAYGVSGCSFCITTLFCRPPTVVCSKIKGKY